VTGELIRLRREALTWREAEGEIVLLDQRTWTYLSVKGAGLALWPQVVAGAPETALRDRLVDRFGIDAAQAEDDVRRFVAMLREHGLLDG
jgi:hypothetical protein